MSEAEETAKPAVFLLIRGVLQPYRVAQGEVVELGRMRGPLAHYLADYANVSGLHGEVRLVGARCQVRDLNSLNGTYVRGVKLEPDVWTEVEPGGEFRLAKDDPAHRTVAAWVQVVDEP